MRAWTWTGRHSTTSLWMRTGPQSPPSPPSAQPRRHPPRPTNQSITALGIVSMTPFEAEPAARRLLRHDRERWIARHWGSVRRRPQPAHLVTACGGHYGPRGAANPPHWSAWSSPRRHLATLARPHPYPKMYCWMIEAPLLSLSSPGGHSHRLAWTRRDFPRGGAYSSTPSPSIYAHGAARTGASTLSEERRHHRRHSRPPPLNRPRRTPAAAPPMEANCRCEAARAAAPPPTSAAVSLSKCCHRHRRSGRC